jgi:hypothetical protein
MQFQRAEKSHDAVSIDTEVELCVDVVEFFDDKFILLPSGDSRNRDHISLPAVVLAVTHSSHIGPKGIIIFLDRTSNTCAYFRTMPKEVVIRMRLSDYLDAEYRANEMEYAVLLSENAIISLSNKKQ